MKKTMIIAFIIIAVMSLSSCTLKSKYQTLNEKINEIDFEESGYMMISNDEIIDGGTRYMISDILSDILVQQEIDAVDIGYNYKVSKTLMFVFVNYYKENDNNRYQTLVVYDFIQHLTIYVESLLTIKKDDQNIYQYMILEVSERTYSSFVTPLSIYL